MKGVYWLSDGGLPASDIDSSLFTHIYYAFADLDPATNKLTIPPWNSNAISTFTQTVRRRNPNVKTLLSIGGGGGDDLRSRFASMASQPRSRRSFIESSIAMARNYGFNGLDLDWEYPSTRIEMALFETLLTEWRAAVAYESQSSGRPQLLLSAAVHRSSNFHGTPIPVQSVNNSLDWINVMSYDFYGPGWSESEAWPPAALYGRGQQANADAGIQEWIQSGMPPNKIAIGLPFFGWAWQVENPNRTGFPARANGRAAGAGINGEGYIFYKDIRRFIAANRGSPVYDDVVVSNYVHSGTTWIGYDGPQAIATKVSYAKNIGLLGYFAWEITGDDNLTLSRTASNTWDE